MKSSQIAAQLYSFRDFIKTEQGFIDTLGRLGEIGYEAVQLSSSIPAMPEERLLEILSDAKMTAPTAHEQADKIINAPESMAKRLLKLGCPHVAYPYPHFEPKSEAEALTLAKTIDAAGERLRKLGVALAYHNHNVEFIRFGSRNLLEIVFDEAKGIEMEIDTFWVQLGGASPLEWVEKSAGRMSVIHLKDFAIAPERSAEGHCKRCLMAPIGSGNINWPRLIPAAEKAGVKTFVVEHDGDCADPFESFKSSFEYLTRNFVS